MRRVGLFTPRSMTLLFMQAHVGGSARPQLDQHLAGFSQMHPLKAPCNFEEKATATYLLDNTSNTRPMLDDAVDATSLS
jgi:hypothetical protein